MDDYNSKIWIIENINLNNLTIKKLIYFLKKLKNKQFNLEKNLKLVFFVNKMEIMLKNNCFPQKIRPENYLKKLF